MTLQTQHPTPEHSPAVLTDEQRQRVADALENAQSENTCYTSTAMIPYGPSGTGSDPHVN